MTVICAGAGTAFAGPSGPVVTVGSASYDPATLTLTSSSARTQISWQSFNVAASEVVTFVQPGAQSTVLNQIFNAHSFNLLGGLRSNGSIFFMANGRVSGGDLNLDLSGAITASLRMPPLALAPSGVASRNQQRPLTTLDGGNIYVISQDEQAVTTASGDVVLNPGKSVELARAALPHLRVGVSAPDAEAINLSRLVAGGHATGIFAALFRAPAAARQAAQGDAETVLTASAPERAPDTQEIERFYRYALMYAYAQPRNEAAHSGGGMLRVAAASSSSMFLPEARSRPSLLPRDIEIGAAAPRRRPAPGTFAALPVPAAQANPAPLERESDGKQGTQPALASVPAAEAAAATPEPQPFAPERGSELDAALQLALAPVPAAVEAAAVPEPLPFAPERGPELDAALRLALAPVPAVIAATATPEALAYVPERGSELDNALQLALAPVPAAVEAAAMPESRPPVPERGSELDAALQLALAPVPAAVEAALTPEPLPFVPERASRPEAEAQLARVMLPDNAAGLAGRPEVAQAAPAEAYPPASQDQPDKSAPAIVVLALAEPRATPVRQEEPKVKEVRIERRAPRYFTDYRGAMFFM